MSHEDFCVRFIPPYGKVLDIGSGRGQFLCAMSKLGFSAFGVEASPDYIAQSKALAAKEGVSISISEASAERLPFGENSFDFVNAAEVSEHVGNPETMIKEIFRVLKRGGQAYVSFHNRCGIYDYHYHMYFINWMPRTFAEIILKIFGKEKKDSIIGRQKLSTMHYYTYGRINKIVLSSGFLIHDIRVGKIKDKFSRATSFFLFLYLFILRPFYFNTFHFLLKKP